MRDRWREMEDAMNRTQFFEDADGGYASFSHPKHFSKTWNKVLAFEESIGKSLDDGYTREEYIRLFNFALTRCTSTFPNDKKAIMFYVRYMVAHGALPKEQEDILCGITPDDLSIKGADRIRYFKNLNHLREAIEDTVKVADRVDETVFDVPSAILYLAWYGLTEEQVLTLPKTAVLEDGIMLDGKKIEMPYFVTELLNRLKEADGFNTKGKGIIFRKYVYSENLIRTEDSYQLNVFQMRANLSRMDRIMDHAYSLKFDTARQSGIFYRAYMLECESSNLDLSDPVFASRIFCENLYSKENKADPAKRYRQRMRDYALYKQLFS